MTAPRVLVAIFSFAIANIVSAQAYPSKPIRLIVPSAPGGLPDITARIVANEIGKQMGQQVVVDNRGGAAGIIGTDMVAKAAPDGYTIGSAPFTFVTNPSLFVRLPYDTANDFQPVVRTIGTVNVLAVTLSLPVKSVQELVDQARAQPGKLSYGSTAGGSQLLAVELLKSITGTQIMQVSYKGIQQAITDVIGGQVHIVCDNLGSILPHVKAGKLRGLGITTLKRSTIVPELPTLNEAGISGFEMMPWGGYVAPARVPREVVLRLNTEVNKVLRLPSVSEKLTAMGSLVLGGTPEEYADHIRRETEKWAKVIKTAGIKPQ